ncbi:MAG: hypothetical protein EOO73_19665 [Myxococcales bacterium]|nr:MAG: hypothetical protein EOO73_19665 [Myxococcales bacterium]
MAPLDATAASAGRAADEAAPASPSVSARSARRPECGADRARPRGEGSRPPASTALKLAECALNLVQQADTKVSLLGLVAAGVGLSVVSKSVTELSRRGVVFRPFSGQKLRLVLSAPTSSSPTPRAAALLTLLRQAFPRHA